MQETRCELEIVTELIRKCIEENARTAIKPDVFKERYNGYLERYNTANSRIKELELLLHERKLKFDALGNFIADIERRELINDQFDESLWLATVDRVTIYADEKMVFRFKDGTKIEA